MLVVCEIMYIFALVTENPLLTIKLEVYCNLK